MVKHTTLSLVNNRALLSEDLDMNGYVHNNVVSVGIWVIMCWNAQVQLWTYVAMYKRLHVPQCPPPKYPTPPSHQFEHKYLVYMCKHLYIQDISNNERIRNRYRAPISTFATLPNYTSFMTRGTIFNDYPKIKNFKNVDFWKSSFHTNEKKRIFLKVD